MQEVNKDTLLIEQHYLPNIFWFCLVISHQNLLIEAHESFQKQTYRNRCYVLAANKVERLTVPVKVGNQHLPIREIEIDYKQKWQNKHWRTIQSAYGKAPFFEFYEDYFKGIIYSKPTLLFDLNQKLLSLCLKILGAGNKIAYTNSYQSLNQANISDLRGQLRPEDRTGTIHAIPYGQLFGDNFEANLSIIDLLFNKGPESLSFLKAQAKLLEIPQ